jgi:protein ImuB
MDRLACLELPDFPLQLALRTCAHGRGEPVALIERDAPHALLLGANAAARAQGVQPGQRYAAALGNCARLRAHVFDAAELQCAQAELVRELQHFSPQVEPSAQEPGLFWIGARGLEPLFGSLRAWADALLHHVQQADYEARLALGFRHFALSAAVKTLPLGALAFYADEAQEARAAASLSLTRLALEPQARAALAKLAIGTLGAFARLPAAGILRRFGAAAQQLHREASGALDAGFAPQAERIPCAAAAELEFHDGALGALLAQVEELLRGLCAELAQRAQAAAAIELRLALDDGSTCEERLVPAWPSSDADWLLRLVRMRLESRQLAGRVERVELELARVDARAEQAGLALGARTRSRDAAAKALGALRAALGEQAVVRARLASAHLPEHSFAWEPCEELPAAAPELVREAPLVRAIFEHALELPPHAPRERDPWLLRGRADSRIVQLRGPHCLSGGWWRAEVRREYYFAELESGEIAWIYRDLARRRWCWQGTLA